MSRTPIAATLALLLPVAAHAQTSPANSTLPFHVLMVGLREGVPDTTVGALKIVARDASRVPEPGKTIELRTLNCRAARLATDQRQLGASTRCATHGVTAVTDANGMVRFADVGSSEAQGLHGMGPCAQVYSNRLAIDTVRVAYLDLDGSGGLGSNDLSVWLGDFGSGEPVGRSAPDLGPRPPGRESDRVLPVGHRAGRSQRTPSAPAQMAPPTMFTTTCTAVPAEEQGSRPGNHGNPRIHGSAHARRFT